MQTTAFLGVAHIHTPGFLSMIQKRGDVRIKAVYDHDSARAEKVAQQGGATVSSIDDILNDTEITSVIVCSETAHHLDLVTRAAKAKKHLFVEKPLAISAEDAAKMQAEVEKAGVVFQTGFFLRGNPQNQWMKREVAAGNLGNITRMRYSNCHEGALGGWFDTQWNWIANKELAGGGGFADLAAHALDIILWTLRSESGGPCGEVKKAFAALGSATHRYGDIDEYGTGLLQFDSGASAVVDGSWVDPKLHSPVEVFGDKGQIQIFEDGRTLYFSDLVEGADGGEWTDFPQEAPHAFNLFFDKLDGKEIAIPLISVAEAAAESRVMSQMYGAAGA